MRNRWLLTACCLVGATLTAVAHQPARSTAAAKPATTWIGREPQMEAHLRTAEIVSVEDIGTGVTNPKRAHLKPAEPFDSLVWKPLPPGRPSGYLESYKSEIAAYELDKLFEMNMVPPAVERDFDGKTGAAIMWVRGMESVKQKGGKVPTEPQWARPLRKMKTFDNFIGNPDRNAGNLLLGPPGELVLIDHSRAFTNDAKLPWKVERVDAELWRRIQAVTRDDLTRTIGLWTEAGAIDAMLERRKRVAEAVEKLLKKKNRQLVIVE
jgi:hypothetical protein